jgi:hypothetical protein
MISNSILSSLIFGFYCTTGVVAAAIPSEAKLKTLYNSLDPTSIAQHLAFYELYSSHPQGQQALKDAWQILAGFSTSINPLQTSFSLAPTLIQTLIASVNKSSDKKTHLPDAESLQTLIQLSSHLPHFKLQGHHVWNEAEVLQLPLKEIDLARGLFLSQLGEDKLQIQAYEALIDLMALQILARLPPKASAEDKIRAINAFVFDEMEFRFPPHSLYAKDIDVYTFLPSVLDSHRGVCLGVSILYLCLAQRLALPLEMITPPGHIYVRYNNGSRVINIETTARGIHLDSENYLNVNTRLLQQRTIREVIGMAHFNQASVYWQNGDYAKALQAYLKAEPYMRDDPLLKELMGYTLLLTGQKEEGESLLWEVKDIIPDYALTRNTMIDDYFNGAIDAEGIKVIFMQEDDEQQAILSKKEALKNLLVRYPRFREGWLYLAMTWLQLHRVREALEALRSYELLDENHPEIQYYLSILYGQRHDFPHSWFHLKQAEALVKKHSHDPRDLKELRRQLLTYCPEQ